MYGLKPPPSTIESNFEDPPPSPPSFQHLWKTPMFDVLPQTGPYLLMQNSLDDTKILNFIDNIRQ